jgi:hypothetical protein
MIFPKPTFLVATATALINLVKLLSVLTRLRVYDNSATADPATGQAPHPVLMLHMERGHIIGPSDLTSTPAWVKLIAAKGVGRSSCGSACVAFARSLGDRADVAERDLTQDGRRSADARGGLLCPDNDNDNGTGHYPDGVT